MMTDLFDSKSIFNNLVSSALWACLGFLVAAVLYWVKRQTNAKPDKFDFRGTDIPPRDQADKIGERAPQQTTGSITFELPKPESDRLDSYLHAKKIRDTTLILENVQNLTVHPKDGLPHKESAPGRLEVRRKLPKDEYIDILIDGVKAFDVSLRFSITFIDREEQEYAMENKKQSFPLRFKIGQSLRKSILNYSHEYELQEEFPLADCLMAYKFVLSFLTGKKMIFRPKGLPELSIELAEARSEMSDSDAQKNHIKRILAAFEKIPGLRQNILKNRRNVYQMAISYSEIAIIEFFSEYIKKDEYFFDDAKCSIYIDKTKKEAKEILTHKLLENLKLESRNFRMEKPFLGGSLVVSGRTARYYKARIVNRRLALLRYLFFFWQKATKITVKSVGARSVGIQYGDIRYLN